MGFAANLLYIAMLALVVISTLDKLGVPTMSFFAALGAAGLAIALALKSSLSNFASGVMLIWLRPFKVGDRIEAAGVKGAVGEIQVFATVLRTEDNKKITIPNAAVAGGTITNYSAD